MIEVEVDPASIPGLKFHTARDLSLPTLGHRQARFARVWFGREFMPWQSLVANVLGELKPNGAPAHPLGLVTVARQAGKSDLSMARTSERCFSHAGWRAWYTAQTGADARDQFLKFADVTLKDTALASVVRTLRGKGDESMKYPNGSEHRPYPPTEEKLHGKQSDSNDIDEAWAFDRETGKLLLQAGGPTELTRPAAQTVIWSAGGTPESTWLADLIARGRAGDPTIAYFELGIPDDLPLDDLEAVARFHPAYGYTITLDSIRALRDKLDDEEEFARAIGNRWTGVIGGAINAATWATVRRADPIPDDVPLGFGAARDENGSQVAIACAALVDGVVVVEMCEVLPTAYLAGEHVKHWAKGLPIAVRSTGASASLLDELRRLNTPNLLEVTATESVAAVGQLLDALPHKGYVFRKHPALDDAVKAAGKRRTAEGGQDWCETTADAPIAALRAATLAAHAVKRRRVGKPKSRAPRGAAA